MGTSIVRETRRARKEHCCNICMGPIRRGRDYDYEVVMTRRGSKRNKTLFYVWRTHTEAPACDEQATEYERQFMEVPAAVVAVLKFENRVVQKIAINGSVVTETESVLVSSFVNESEIRDNSGSDDEDDIAF